MKKTEEEVGIGRREMRQNRGAREKRRNEGGEKVGKREGRKGGVKVGREINGIKEIR